MIRRLGILVCVTALALAGGCRTTPAMPKFTSVSARFFMESRSGEQGLPITLPISRVTLNVDPRAILLEFDITGVQLVQGEFGPGLMFLLTTTAARDLYRISASSQGRRLVLSLNGAPVSATPFAGPLGSGAVVVYPEVAPESMAELARNLDLTSIDIQSRAVKK